MPAFFAIIFFSLLQLQPEQFERYDTGSGLSNNIIYDVYQDSKGFMWIATENGLNRYDAYNFESFYHDPEDSTSISSNTVRSIIEDKDNNLWIGTFNGLNKYDRETGRFKKYQKISGYPLQRLDIQFLTIDGEGNLWFPQSDVVIRFNPRTEKFSTFLDEPGSYQIFKDQNLGIWVKKSVGNSRTLFQFNAKTEMFTAYTVSNQQKKTPVYFGKYSQVLWLKDPPGESLPFQNQMEIPDLPGELIPRRLLEDRTGRLWIGTDNGLFLHERQERSLQRLSLGTNSEALGNSIRKLYEDDTRAVWVATLNGLYRYDPNQKAFSHFKPSEFTSGKSKQGIVLALEEEKQGLWIGLLGNGLYYFNPKTKKARKYRLVDKVDKNEAANQVWNIFRHPSQSHLLWLGTSAGLFKLNTITGRSQKIELPHRNIAASVIFSIIRADSTSIWAAGDEDVYRVNINTGIVIDHLTLYGHNTLSTIQSLHLYNSHTLLIGTEGVGLIMYDTDKRILFSASDVIPADFELVNISVWSILEDKQHRIWLGTSGGLYQLDMQAKELIPFRESGKSESIVYSILQDSSGQLWMGTDKGLSVFNPQTNFFLYYNTEDRLQNNEFNRRAALQTDDGNFWFGGIDGLTYFRPSEIKENPVIPPTYITSVQIFNSEEVQSVSSFKEERLNLSWNDNTIEINFTGLNYTNPDQNKYRYRLQNLDPNWVEAGNRRFARYTKIPHGEYLFRVQAANNDGIWNREGTSLAIIVTPPFWDTAWFKFIIAGIVISILWAMYKYRINKIIEMERMRLRIAGDLHDEIGSGLSGIALSGDLLRQQVDQTDTSSKLIERIAGSARELAGSLDTIVWLIDPQKDTLADLITKCKDTANDLLQSFDLCFDIVGQPGNSQRELSAHFRRNIYLFFKETVHNIMRHSESSNVVIVFTINNSSLSIGVSDDGKGFDLMESTNGHGLESLRRRAEAMNAELNIDSKSGLGTRVSLKVKLP